MDHVIQAQIIMGHGKNNTDFILEILLTSTHYFYRMRRLQFPLKLSFAMTINKAQVQSLKVVGLDFRKSCFSHGQFYVDSSRVGHRDNLFIYAPEGKTKNIMYKNVKQKCKTFCEDMQEKLEDDNFENRPIFSDEAILHTNGKVNK
ncbi:uncharacterized protein LOC115211986 [Octopus sinensis]|uniref:Uncharacterized protein LOC115211986 n=1 Tax=Octopus sinensis TaxID=2607531 RepID=A0A6P7SF85_9MOLL|nr:uncharacterized protein LOC115211986 [Octopus sinensis]